MQTVQSIKNITVTLLLACMVAGSIVTSAQADTFNRNLHEGMSGEDVHALQVLLNQDTDTQVAANGAGSAGNETNYFGSRTTDAVKRYQAKYHADILAALGLFAPTGYFGEATRAALTVESATMPFCEPGKEGVVVEVPTTKLTVGTKLVTIAGLQIRANMGTTSPFIGVVATGTAGTILEQNVPLNGLYWQKVQYENGMTGWNIGSVIRSQTKTRVICKVRSATPVTTAPTSANTATSSTGTQPKPKPETRVIDPARPTTTKEVVKPVVIEPTNAAVSVATSCPAGLVLYKDIIGTSTALKVGDKIVTTYPYRVRQAAGVNASFKKVGQAAGVAGVIVEGPIKKDDLNWFKVDYVTGNDGWNIGGIIRTHAVPAPLNCVTKTNAQAAAVVATTPAPVGVPPVITTAVATASAPVFPRAVVTPGGSAYIEATREYVRILVDQPKIGTNYYLVRAFLRDGANVPSRDFVIDKTLLITKPSVENAKITRATYPLSAQLYTLQDSKVISTAAPTVTTPVAAQTPVVAPEIKPVAPAILPSGTVMWNGETGYVLNISGQVVTLRIPKHGDTSQRDVNVPLSCFTKNTRGGYVCNSAPITAGGSGSTDSWADRHSSGNTTTSSTGGSTAQREAQRESQTPGRMSEMAAMAGG